MSKLEEQIDELQDLAERGYGRGAAVSLDPPGTRSGHQVEWEGGFWNREGIRVMEDAARTKEALVITMLATARERVAEVERLKEAEADEDAGD